MGLGEQVRRLREQRYLSQSELAARAKISKNTLVRIESGRFGVIPRTVRQLAEALGVDPSELVSPEDLRELTGKAAA
jgi:HTH-type transcriptional regulator, competence development regulator